MIDDLRNNLTVAGTGIVPARLTLVGAGLVPARRVRSGAATRPWATTQHWATTRVAPTVRGLGDRRYSEDGGWIAPVLVALIVILFTVTPIALHITQIAHNKLPTVDEAHPAGGTYEPGELFADTIVRLVEHELDGRSGWRPNDFFVWGPGVLADNNANRQLGIIQAVRESTRIFRDHLTKISNEQYDDNLQTADQLFRNDAEKFWFPSAENRYRLGIEHIRKYIAGLKGSGRKSRPINQRNIELIRLFQAWTDLLGDAHARLYDENAPFFQTDDYFYHSQGFAHVMYHLTLAIHREYKAEIDNRPVLKELLDGVAAALHQAASMKPLIVLDGSATGFTANHRRNLSTYTNEARQKMYSIREELEK